MKAFSTAFLSLAFPMISPAQAAEALPSPVNQVFQFAHTAERPGGGHFYCTDAMTEYFARYITAACRARLSDDGGPALVKDGRLVFTTIPPRGRFPVEVSAAAWQRGRSSAPKVRTAPIVRQTFRIHGP